MVNRGYAPLKGTGKSPEGDNDKGISFKYKGTGNRPDVQGHISKTQNEAIHKIQFSANGEDFKGEINTPIHSQLNMGDMFSVGTISRGIDLKGNARFIRSIKLNYRKRVRTLFRGSAYVSVFGK